MSSARRFYAQRNTNGTQIVPEFNGILNQNTPFGDISGAATYTLTLSNAQYIGGSYYVDLSGVDLSGNQINVGGQFISGGNRIFNLNFIVNVPQPASYDPNLEFTIFFKNIPYNGFPGAPVFTIGIISTNGGPPFPYTFSPPAPSIVAYDIFPNITFKSDGTRYTAVSSGPSGWLGPYLLGYLVNSL